MPLLVLACDGFSSDKGAESALGLEACDGEDNDGDGLIDEGFDVGSPCESPGECGAGVLECAGPFGTRCSSAPGASEARATNEICDGKDNDCDGDIDEGFPVGQPCDLAGRCPGVRVCSADQLGTSCVVDNAASGPEVCDGRDNDCDGYVDFSVSATGARSACECVDRRLSFGVIPVEASTAADTAFCSHVRPQCTGTNGVLSMSFCLECSSTPYAMCVSERRADLSSFVQGGGTRALTVRYQFQSDAPSKSLVNLYYEVRPSSDPAAIGVRRYFRLLDIGDVPGTYTKTFFPEQTCFASSETDCGGVQSECPLCRNGDSCGAATAPACDKFSFDLAQLQLAVEDGCPAGETFRGAIDILDMWLGPVPCDPSLGP